MPKPLSTLGFREFLTSPEVNIFKQTLQHFCTSHILIAAALLMSVITAVHRVKTLLEANHSEIFFISMVNVCVLLFARQDCSFSLYCCKKNCSKNTSFPTNAVINLQHSFVVKSRPLSLYLHLLLVSQF